MGLVESSQLNACTNESRLKHFLGGGEGGEAERGGERGEAQSVEKNESCEVSNTNLFQ